MNNNQMRDEQQALQNHVDHIAQTLTAGMTYKEAELDHEEHGAEPTDLISGYDYLSDVLEIKYITENDDDDDDEGEYLGARVLVSFGGPNIWIDTRTCTVEGYWWGDEATATYTDEMNLHGTCQELYEMGA